LATTGGGTQVRTCFNNPKGALLNDWQKAIYCHAPLEFRLCFTSKLLGALADAESKIDGVTFSKKAARALSEDSARCQGSTDKELGGNRAFFLNTADKRAEDVFYAAFLRCCVHPAIGG